MVHITVKNLNPIALSLKFLTYESIISLQSFVAPYIEIGIFFLSFSVNGNVLAHKQNLMKHIKIF